MTRDEQLHIFEQPVTGDTAILTCGHRAAIPRNHKHTRDGWPAAIWCHDCGTRAAVVSVIHPKEPRPAA